MKLLRTLLLFLAVLVCNEAVVAGPVRPRKIRKLLKRSQVLKQYHVGFALYDLEAKKMIAGQLADKYFTPASNTKLFTFYTGLRMLTDSVPGLQYVERGDSLIFWGTGDPSFGHLDFPVPQPVYQRLIASKKKLYWATGRYTGEFYGTGWSYDDYNEYYQPEISELPMNGNIIRFTAKGGQLSSSPGISSNNLYSIVTDSARTTSDSTIKRELLSNVFHQSMISLPDSFVQDVPYKVSPEFDGKLLSASFPNYAGMIKTDTLREYKTMYNVPADTLYKRMLLPSDNFIAEQLLLTYAAANNLEMNTKTVIAHALKNYLSDLPDKPQWVDGSGLSRQNLFTPRSMVRLCEKIYEEVNDEKRLFDLLPQGGRSGTIKNLYRSAGGPFIFAKTGSLSNNACLSGYLVTGKGKKLIFSFMNNSFVVPTADVRNEMERILTYIHEKY